MGDDFLAYLERVEMMAFFCGYPLLYAIVNVLGESKRTVAAIKRKLAFLLPFAYAMAGTLYFGLFLKNLYPNLSIESIRSTLQGSYLKIWALSALLFWIPALSKKPVFSLLHSLVFFFFVTKDLFLHLSQSTDKSTVRNDMNIYTLSFIINLASLVFILLIYYLITFIRKKKGINSNSVST